MIKRKSNDCVIKKSFKKFCKKNKPCNTLRKMNRNRKIFLALYKVFKVLISVANIALLLYVLYGNVFGEEEE